MIKPRRIIQSSDDKFLISAAKNIGVTSEELFFGLESMGNTGKINGFSITKKKEEEEDGNYFSYLIKKKEETIRIVCDF